MSDYERDLVPFQSYLPATQADDSEELGWIAKESVVARAQREAQLAHDRDIQGATAALGAYTADYSARGMEAMAASQRSLESPELRRIQAQFIRERLLPTMQQALDNNYKAGVANFNATRRTFAPPPRMPKKKILGIELGR